MSSLARKQRRQNARRGGDRLSQARTAHRAGRRKEAEAGYEAVLADAPDSLPALQYLGVLRAEAGDKARAYSLLSRAAELAPQDSEVLSNLAWLYRQAGQFAQAHSVAAQGLAADPANQAARYSKAVAARELDAFAEAATELDTLLDALGDQPAVLYQRGRTALGQGEPAQAAALFARADKRQPGDPAIVVNWAVARFQQGAIDAALALLDGVAAKGERLAEWQHWRGRCLAALDRPHEAVAAFRQAAALDDRRVHDLHHTAQALEKLGALTEAETAIRDGLARLQTTGGSPHNQALLWNNLGAVLRQQLRLAEAKAAYGQALALDPSLSGAAANQLLNLHYDPAETAGSLAAAHRAWQQRHAAAIEAAATPPPAGPPDKAPLTVGLLAAKQHHSPALLLYWPGLANLDPQAVRLVVYDLGSRDDAANQALRDRAQLYRDVAELADSAIADQIRADGVDILINKMGHAEGRTTVCAHKPAPVQVQWGGYNTSALASMDWFLGDPVACPAGCEPYFTEAIYRLPDGYVVYEPPADLPPVTALPARRNGFVTFGCFNNAAKLNSATLALWGALMARVPGSQLYLRGDAFDDPPTCARARAMLAEAGIPAERVHLGGRLRWAALMDAYQDVDIALDPWPYSGGLTTIEAMWMGVPTLTLPGPSFVGRHAASHLTNAGLADWVAQDRADFLAKGAAWAGDWAALAELRAGLRPQVAASPLSDGPRFARNLEAAFRDMWQRQAASG